MEELKNIVKKLKEFMTRWIIKLLLEMKKEEY